MKTKDDYQKAIDEIKAVCKKHDVVLIGSCLNEGVDGEIIIEDAGIASDTLDDFEKALMNKLDEDKILYKQGFSPIYVVKSIG